MSLLSELDCGPCRLRAWRMDDHDALVRYANNPNIWRNVRDRFPQRYTPAHAQMWLQQHAVGQPPEGHWAIAIGGGEAIGALSVERMSDVERYSAKIGYWLAEPFWGRGLVTAALRTATEHALEQSDIIRLQADAYSWNPASMRVLEKAGYEREGVLKRAAVKDFTVVDVVLYARTRDPGMPYVPFEPR